MPLGLPDTLSRAPLRRRAPLAWLARRARSRPRRTGISETAPSLMRPAFALRAPDTLCRAPLRRRARLAWLARRARSRPRRTGISETAPSLMRPAFAPRTSRHALARGFAGALRSRGSLAASEGTFNERWVSTRRLGLAGSHRSMNAALGAGTDSFSARPQPGQWR